MAEQQQDVLPESSTGEEQKQEGQQKEQRSAEDVVKEVFGEGDKPQQEQQEGQEQSSDSPEVNFESKEVDERGVPALNVAQEALRKINQLKDTLPDMLKQTLTEHSQTQKEKQEPEYNKAQLKAWIHDHPEAPTENKIWVLNKIDELEKKERQQEIKDYYSQNQKQATENQLRGQAMSEVAAKFPQCFTKDGAGNLDWDLNDELTKEIGKYMNKYKHLQDNPEGVLAAAKMAAYDLGIAQTRTLKNKVKLTNAQLRREQKKQLVSTDGVHPKQSTKAVEAEKAWAEYKRTGSRDAFTRAMKLRGHIPNIE